MPRGSVRAVALLVAGVYWSTAEVPRVVAQVPSAVRAESDVPAPPGDVGAAKAYGMLDRNCAGCHQTGRSDGARAGGGIANLLALDEVARDPALVRPGVPDASRIYAVALTREMHLDLMNDPATAKPTAEELQSLRDWIADLPPRSLGECSRRPRITAAQAGTLVEAYLAGVSAETARQTRFVSLVNLYNDCASWAELEGLRRGLRELLAGVAVAAPVDATWPRAVDPGQLILALPLPALGWTGENWNALMQAYPLAGAVRVSRALADATGTTTPLVSADWLADAILDALDPDPDARRAGPLRGRLAARASQVGASGARGMVWGLLSQHALQRAWARPLDLHRAAADAWLEPAELLSRISRVEGRVPLALQQLRRGGVTRRVGIGPLLAELTAGSARVVSPVVGGDDEALELALWVEAERYRAGDVATFHAQANRDCHLTIVDVDRSGRATVLFPNEFQPDNLIQGGRALRFPAPDAAYRFRFKEKGRETVIAICSLTHKSPVGVLHDYERFRFTMLGDWQLFLREPPELREARRDDAATDTPRPLATQRRRGRGSVSPKVDAAPSGADIQTRTAITIDVE